MFFDKCKFYEIDNIFDVKIIIFVLYNLFSFKKLVYKLRNCNLILFDVY